MFVAVYSCWWRVVEGVLRRSSLRHINISPAAYQVANLLAIIIRLLCSWEHPVESACCPLIHTAILPVWYARFCCTTTLCQYQTKVYCAFHYSSSGAALNTKVRMRTTLKQPLENG